MVTTARVRLKAHMLKRGRKAAGIAGLSTACMSVDAHADPDGTMPNAVLLERDT